MSQSSLLTIQVATGTRPAALLQGFESWFEQGLITDGHLAIDLQATGLETLSDSQVTLALPIAAADFLQGLRLWVEQGVLNQGPIQITATVSSTHPGLLVGLDDWLQLGLLSDSEVKLLCQQHLTCQLVVRAVPEPVAATTAPLEDAVAVEQPAPIGRLAQIFNSLMAELSVLWLLLLGVLMVVISSGVLAVSLWQRFPAVGQYSILWFYTLVFGGAGFWANRRANLQLTTQALWVTAILLLPVNFLAIDSLRLWQGVTGWLVAAISAVTLTTLTGWIYQIRVFNQPHQWRLSLPLVNYLGLSYLQLGWMLPGWPLLSNYLSILGTIGLTLAPQAMRSPSPPQRNGLNLHRALMIYAIALLLLRAILIYQVDLPQLGLAIGLNGWLLTQTAGRSGTANSAINLFWERLGALLLSLGWLLSVGSLPWQALAVSGLGLWFLLQRLGQTWSRVDLTAILLVGLQAMWLGWRILPDSLQNLLVTTVTRLTGAEQTPLALLSVSLLPYLWVILAIADGLMQVRKRQLALFAGWWGLLFSSGLSWLGLVNPLLRTINLALSGVAWGILTRRQWQRNLTDQERLKVAHPWLQFLATLSHTLVLLAFLSGIDWQQPRLGVVAWAGGLLGLMLLEWILGWPQAKNAVETGHFRALLLAKSWELGLILAGLAYGLLMLNQLAHGFNLTQVWGHAIASPNYGAIWLMTPIALTGLMASLPLRRQQASQLSVTALGFAQLLTLAVAPTRLLGLGVAAGLMVINTRRLRNLPAAIITIGFGLGLLAAVVVQIVPGLTLDQWLLGGAMITGLLWVAAFWLARQEKSLAGLYQKASDRWAKALCVATLSGLTLHSLLVFWRSLPPSIVALGAAMLLLLAIAFWGWQQPGNLALYGMGWSLELVTLEGVSFTGKSLVVLAIANIGLGLLTQLIGDWWHRRGGRHQEMLNGWHVLPLLYGALGTALRANVFSRWTGWSTLGLVLIGIGVGRRRSAFKPLLYLSVAGISVAAYQLLAYQVAGQTLGDQLLAAAVLATSLVYAYRILTPWLVPYLRLSPTELRWIAHIHWALGSGLLLIGLFYPVEVNKLTGLGAGLFLTRYAVMQGRHHPRLKPGEVWVYLGLLQAAVIMTYASLTIPPLTALARLLRPWSGALTAIVAALFAQFPWQTWGWSSRPWRVGAALAPLLAISLSLPPHPMTLLVVAGFYLWLARSQSQPRWLYLSLGFVDWMVLNQLGQRNLLTPFLALALMGVSILLIPLFEPALRPASARSDRHLLRLFGVSVICGAALVWHHHTGLLPGFVSLVAILSGLALRTRAYLFVGTAVFLANVFYQLVLLSLTYPLIKWIVGFILGICFIWVAASFETRRGQWTTLVRSWATELAEWE